MRYVSVVIVTYNSVHCVLTAIRSLAGADEIIVVDNRSGDASADLAAHSGAHVIRNQINMGYATACNRGAQIAKGEFLLFVNPDAVLRADTIGELLKVATSDPHIVAVTGSAVATAHDHSAERLPIELQPPHTVDEMVGAVLLVRKTAFESVGGFDEKFFLYFEDQDLSLRLSEVGTLKVAPAARFYHVNGKSSLLTRRGQFEKYRHYARSRVRFTRKHGRVFAPYPEAGRQIAKALIARVKTDLTKSMQHIGRAVGYMEAYWHYTSSRDF